MLILGRRANQSIVFPGCGIKVRILDVNGRVTKIGIDAPRHIQVMRGELATTASTTQSAPNALPYSTALQTDAPESEPGLLQFSQRLDQIKAYLHIFQQLRAEGDEAKADDVLADLLEEIASLDRDWITSQMDENASSENSSIAEPQASYSLQSDETADPKSILVVSSADEACDIRTTTYGSHPMHWVTVNSVALAKRILNAGEQLDVVVCNCNPKTNENEELVQTLRSIPALEKTLVLVVDDIKSTLEQVRVGTRSGIDGWLARPFSSKDLWQHIVESSRIEP
jgi:carbon storage regulator